MSRKLYPNVLCQRGLVSFNSSIANVPRLYPRDLQTEVFLTPKVRAESYTTVSTYQSRKLPVASPVHVSPVSSLDLRYSSNFALSANTSPRISALPMKLFSPNSEGMYRLTPASIAASMKLRDTASETCPVPTALMIASAPLNDATSSE